MTDIPSTDLAGHLADAVALVGRLIWGFLR
jgi:hypothetical protein